MCMVGTYNGGKGREAPRKEVESIGHCRKLLLLLRPVTRGLDVVIQVHKNLVRSVGESC